MELIIQLCQRYREELNNKNNDGKLLDTIENLMISKLGDNLTYYVMDTLCTVKYNDNYVLGYIKAIFDLKESSKNNL